MSGTLPATPLDTSMYMRYHVCMSNQASAPQVKSIADARRDLADILHDAAILGRITYITNRGRKVAAIVPLHVAEEAAKEGDDA